ncbi:hypothetical protein D9M68_797940 [compost metagenome]
MASGDEVNPACASRAARIAAALAWPAWKDFASEPKFARVPAAWATAMPMACAVCSASSASRWAHAAAAPIMPMLAVTCQPFA